MRRMFVAFALAVAACAWAQDKTAPAASQTPTYTLSLGTKLVVVDVSVRDKHGNPVHGLKLGDFTLSENGRPQQIRNFDEHTAASVVDGSKPASSFHLPPGDFTNLERTPPNASLNVILIDRLNTPLAEQMYLSQQLRAYAKQARPDSRTAVFGLSDRLFLLQGFTSDPALLLKALDMSENARQASTPGYGEANEKLVNPRIADVVKDTAPVAAAQMKEFQRQVGSKQNQDRAKMTLDALNQLGRALVNLPGHKNLIWFSGDFPPEFFPGDNDPKLPAAQFAGLEDEFQETINLLTRSRVSVYPVDAQGLRTSQINNASEENPQYAHPPAPNVGYAAGSQHSQELADVSPEFSQDLNVEMTRLGGEHAAMEQIAADTGGTAFYNTNDLTKATRLAIADGSEFYTLTYEPGEEGHRQGYRNISVKLAGTDYRLSYRRGYYTEKESKSNEMVLVNDTQPRAGEAGVRQALRLGSPEATEIVMRIHVALAADGVEKEVLTGNYPTVAKMHAPYQRYMIEFAASPRNVTFVHGADNLYHADLEFVTCLYDSEGVLLNTQSNTIRTDYDNKGMQEVLHGGIVFNQMISVPVKGDLFLRTIVHDTGSGHLGAVELPIAAIADLPPYQASLRGRDSH
jgi:VWFA-related protein